MSGIADVKLDRRSFVRGALMLGAASPLLLSACSSESDTSGGGGSGGGGNVNWLTWSDHYSNDQLAKVAVEYQDHRPAEAVLRQCRCLPSGQADRTSVRHGLGRRAVGEEVHGERPHRAVRPGFDLVELRAVPDGQEVRVPQRSEGRARIPVLVVDGADLLQPRQGQDPADIVGVADRSDVQGPDRRREHPDRPDGDRRNRHRFQGSPYAQTPDQISSASNFLEPSNRTWSSSPRRTTRS